MKGEFRFRIINDNGSIFGKYGRKMIIVDNITGVYYLWVQRWFSSSLIPLLDENGNVTISRANEPPPTKDINGKPIFDITKPIGSRLNPEMAGGVTRENCVMSFYDSQQNKWIMTDGYGNGVIR